MKGGVQLFMENLSLSYV